MLIFVSQMLVGCTSSNEQAGKKEVVKKENINGKTLLAVNANQIVSQKLEISNKCIGCNYCVATDPEHFSRNYKSRIPNVISQKNLDSLKLKTVVKRCPARSISMQG